MADQLVARLRKPDKSDGPEIVAEFDGIAETADSIESDPLDVPSDDGWTWVAVIQAQPAMPRERQLPCALEIEAGVLADAILAGEMTSSILATKDELRTLSQRGRRAFEEMYVGNLRLVLHWARHHGHRDVDLIQESFQDGCLGLARAIEGWDALRGYTFSTYASWHIRQRILRGQQDTKFTIRIPVHVQDSWASAAKHGTALDALSTYAQALVTRMVSWDAMREELELFECAALTQVPVDEEVCDRVATLSLLRESFACLTDKEQFILAGRSGLDADDPQTLEDLGQALGVTRERVRQIESRAIKRLQAHWDSVSETWERSPVAAPGGVRTPEVPSGPTEVSRAQHASEESSPSAPGEQRKAVPLLVPEEWYW